LNCFSVERVTGAAEHVLDLVPDEVFDALTGRAHVLARIEFLRVFGEHLADAGGHGHAEVGVDVDLGATHAAGHFDVGFRHALRVGHLAAVLVDLGDEILRHAGGSVQHERIIAEVGIHERLLDGFEAFEIQVLFALELEGTMAVADGDGEGIAAGFFDKFDGFFGVRVVAAGGVGTAFFTFVELGTDQVAELGFHGAVMLVRVFHHFAGDFGVLFEGFVGGVDHDAGETFVDALFAKIERIAVVQVNRDRDVGKADGGLNELLEVNRVGVLARTLGNLEDERGFFFFAGFNNGLDEFHVIDVESTEGVFALERFGEQVFGMCQWHKCELWLRANPVVSPTMPMMIRNLAGKKNKKFVPLLIKLLVMACMNDPKSAGWACAAIAPAIPHKYCGNPHYI